MQRLSFSKWDPSGNLTLFLPAELPAGLARRRAEIARLAMGQACLNAEQAGFADIAARTLQMAGNEFCVNATRSFGALAALAQARSQGLESAPIDAAFDVTVSGWPCPVRVAVKGVCPAFEVEAKLGLAGLALEATPDGATTVHLPGISHRLMPQASHPLPRDLLPHARQILCHAGLDRKDACGAVWWQEAQGELAITPVVYVPGAGTLVAEQACGSATLSLALALASSRGQRRFAIRQPSGDRLTVVLEKVEKVEKEEQGASGAAGRPDATAAVWATVGGTVRLVCEGELYLPDA